MPFCRINSTDTGTPAHMPHPVLPAGFSLVELVMVIVIVGTLATVAAPRFFDFDVFQQRGFADQVQATLRYAQKQAIAQRRNVCATLAAGNISLRIASTSGMASACDTDLNFTSGGNSVNAPSGITLSPATTIIFDALGRPTAGQTFTVGGNSIVVEAVTGYVH